jgi:hypothetical protein
LKILKKRKVVAHFFNPGENNLALAEKGPNRPLVREKENAHRIPVFPSARRSTRAKKPKVRKTNKHQAFIISTFQRISSANQCINVNTGLHSGAGSCRAEFSYGFP